MEAMAPMRGLSASFRPHRSHCPGPPVQWPSSVRVSWVEEAQVVGRRMSRPAATSASVRKTPKMG